MSPRQAKAAFSDTLLGRIDCLLGVTFDLRCSTFLVALSSAALSGSVRLLSPDSFLYHFLLRQANLKMRACDPFFPTDLILAPLSRGINLTL